MEERGPLVIAGPRSTRAIPFSIQHTSTFEKCICCVGEARNEAPLPRGPGRALAAPAPGAARLPAPAAPSLPGAAAGGSAAGGSRCGRVLGESTRAGVVDLLGQCNKLHQWVAQARSRKPAWPAQSMPRYLCTSCIACQAGSLWQGAQDQGQQAAADAASAEAVGGSSISAQEHAGQQVLPSTESNIGQQRESQEQQPSGAAAALAPAGQADGQAADQSAGLAGTSSQTQQEGKDGKSQAPSQAASQSQEQPSEAAGALSAPALPKPSSGLPGDTHGTGGGVPMAATRVVMHQIVLPAEVDSLGICFGGQVGVLCGLGPSRCGVIQEA